MVSQPTARLRAVPALAILVASIFVFAAAAGAKTLAEYQPGDIAEQDIVATVPLTVLDLVQTETIRADAAERVPAVFRADPDAGKSVEEAFLKGFIESRERFLSAFEKKFETRKLEGDQVSAEVADFCASFPLNPKYLPGTEQLHLTWAKGGAGEELAVPLRDKLRAAMHQNIRPNTLAADLRTSPRVRLLSPDGSFTEVARSAVISLDRARTNLYAQFGANDAPLARYLAGFIRPNCEADEDASRDARDAAIGKLTAARQYTANQLIVRRGEAITPQIKLALDELQARTPAVKTVYKTVSVPTPVEPALGPWVWAALGAGTVLVVVSGSLLMLRLRRRQPGLALATTDEWRARALEAERRADRATALVRTDLTTQLAKTLTDDLVKKLVEQRNDLLTTQQAAATEMAAIADRLEQLDTPAKKEYYERRISELEQQLADKDAQNRALLEEQIRAARRQLEETQARMRLN